MRAWAHTYRQRVCTRAPGQPLGGAFGVQLRKPFLLLREGLDPQLRGIAIPLVMRAGRLGCAIACSGCSSQLWRRGRCYAQLRKCTGAGGGLLYLLPCLDVMSTSIG